VKGDVLKYAIKQRKGSLEIYALKSSFCIPQLSGTFGWTDSRTTGGRAFLKFQDAALISTYWPVNVEAQYAALTGIVSGENGYQIRVLVEV
jgi:hypothetical protein